MARKTKREAAKTSKPTGKPRPKMSSHGFMIYPMTRPDGRTVYVSVPPREE